MARRKSALSTCLVLAATMAAGSLSTASAATPHESGRSTGKAGGNSTGNTAQLPPVTPTPQSLDRAGADAAVSERVFVVADGDTDPAARDRLVKELRSHGAGQVDVVAPDSVPPAASEGLTVRLGPAGRPDIAEGLGGTSAPDHAEGYALRVHGGGQGARVDLGGTDATGQYYAVQTLRQLLTQKGDGWNIAGAAVSDFPSMPLRGTIEGFYGDPWTPGERLDQMDFYGDVKANTYIYAPKDDPYHRSKWRDPYPADKMDELGKLVDRAEANHVRFTFAVSPGESICYSDQSDRKALKAKLEAMYQLGVRAFSIPLDDISYTEWNCAADEKAYGAPGRESAAKAQVDLLNDVQKNFIGKHEDAQPLQMVPTEYSDVSDTAYKKTMRETLDPAVEVMWTGTDVVPPEVTNDQADAASKVFGRKVFLWDNYPVNDFDKTSGRLLLAPYAKREAGLSEHLTGVVANPMNQPYASKPAVFGAAGFGWNDKAYDPEKNWQQAMSYLAGGDKKATGAMLVFGDLERMAPTFGDTPWQEQAPGLKSRTGEFWKRWEAGEQEQAIEDLRPYAAAVKDAPGTIRAGEVQKGFATDAAPWLDATELWGKALVKTLDALAAKQSGDDERAAALLAESDAFQKKAGDVRTDPPRNKWGKVQPKVGDGVLDTFLKKAGDQLRA